MTSSVAFDSSASAYGPCSSSLLNFRWSSCRQIFSYLSWRWVWRTLLLSRQQRFYQVKGTLCLAWNAHAGTLATANESKSTLIIMLVHWEFIGRNLKSKWGFCRERITLVRARSSCRFRGPARRYAGSVRSAQADGRQLWKEIIWFDNDIAFDEMARQCRLDSISSLRQFYRKSMQWHANVGL